MHTNILTTAAALSDDDLLACLQTHARREREASVELVAHLAVLDTRPALYAADGYGSLFGYCTQALRLSEDAACNRIEAARACRREIETLVAELAPRADVPSLIRRLPAMRPETAAEAEAKQGPTGAPAPPPSSMAPLVSPPRPAPRSVVEGLAPERYRVQFTIGQETQDKLRRLQGLLRREIPDGDPGAIFDRAVSLLLETVERKKLGKAARPRPQRAIRPGTDSDAAEGPLPPRDPPNAVKRAVWARDGGRCGYVSRHGRRCEERTYLEFHHQLPHAKRGEATVDNIALRCRRHNQHEADLVFGDGGRSRDLDYSIQPPPRQTSPS